MSPPRFPATAATRAQARGYYLERAVQGLSSGWRLDALRDLPFGVEADLRAPDGTPHRSVYVLAEHAGQGHLTRWFADRGAEVRFVTADLCPAMRAWLDRRGIYTYVTDEEALRAFHRLSELEGIIPALESAHAIAYVLKDADRHEGPIVVCLSGRGDKDVAHVARAEGRGSLL